MKIPQGIQITDYQEFSPQELFANLNSLETSQSCNSRTGFMKLRKKKKDDIMSNFDTILNVTQSKPTFSQARPKNIGGLKKIIQMQKIKSMIRNFVAKLRRNNVNGQPVEYQPFKTQQQSWLDWEGIQLPDMFDNFWSMISIIQIITLTILYTLSLVFDAVLESQQITQFQIFTLVFYFSELVANFFLVKQIEGRKLIKIKQIATYYAKNTFIIDLISFIILMLDVTSGYNQYLTYLRLFIILKVAHCLDKVQKLELHFVDNFYKEHYWGLIKVFLFNFSLAHCLAIILVSIANLNHQNNWIVTKGIQYAPWYEIYAWSYYWGTTIMLTVGFGDIAPSNYKQAICLTLIEAISCMALAYNINCVGNLISTLRSQDIEKNKNYKIFKKLSQKNDIPQDLSWRVNNYIEQSTNIKKKFNFQEENSFISKLPAGLKADFLKQSNKKIFEGLVFFKNLTEKTLLNFAEKIQMRICHPQEIIRRKQDQYSLLILKEGHLGYCCKKTGCDFNDTIIDQIRIKDNQDPFLLSLDFISKNKPNYQIKSLTYAILYSLNFANAISILQGGQLDYEHYCQLRDKSRHVLDEYEIFKCTICSHNHTKFSCPKLHFIPIQQHVLMKSIYKQKRTKSERYNFDRRKRYFATLRNAQKSDNILSSSKKSIKNNFESDQQFEDNIESIQTGQLQTSRRLLQPNYRQKTGVKGLYEFIKDQLYQAINKNISDVWIIQTEEIKNYKFYFTTNNASHLESIYPGS